MGSELLDPAVLRTIPPSAIEAYLAEAGWTVRRSTRTTDVFRKDLPSSWEEVTVPNSDAYSDYPQVVRLVLDTLSEVESRPPDDIAADIMTGGANESVQYRLMADDGTGTVPLDWMIRVLQAHRRLSAAAYMEMTDPRPYYPSMSRGFDALRDMRMGQTSYGSLVVRIIHPPAPGVPTGLADRILSSSRAVVESALDGGDPPEGVSYNFMDSLLSLRSDGGFDIEMAGPRGRGEPPLTIGEGAFPRIRRMAEDMRPRTVGERRVFVGRLRSSVEIEYDEQVSRFRLEYFEGDGTAKADVVLDGRDRRLALESLTDHTLVSLEGRLSGEGRSRTIEDVGDLRVIG